MQVVGCTLRDSGDAAAQIADGTGNTFDGVLIHDTGEGGVSVGGGDRPSLTQAKNVVKNSDIHDFSQFVWTYTPAVNVNGDGNIVQNNVLHGAPHTAILYGGSQHTFSENEIYGVCGFTSDAGAIYSGRDWGARGKRHRVELHPRHREQHEGGPTASTRSISTIASAGFRSRATSSST